MGLSFKIHFDEVLIFPRNSIALKPRKHAVHTAGTKADPDKRWNLNIEQQSSNKQVNKNESGCKIQTGMLLNK